jgi:hypothetical protein
MLRAHAEQISGDPIGVNWVTAFLNRHPHLKVKFTQGLESCRAQALNPGAVKKFYTLIEGLIKEFGILPENLYNMDEKGVQLGVGGGRIPAIVDRDLKVAYNTEHGDREMMTVIECVSADGTVLPPTVVYPGAMLNLEWGRDNPCGARYFFFLD